MVEMKTRNEVSSLLEPGRVRLKRGTVSFPQIATEVTRKKANFRKQVSYVPIPDQITFYACHGLSGEAILLREESIPE